MNKIKVFKSTKSMVNVKKKKSNSLYFVILLTFIGIPGCSSQFKKINQTDATLININNSYKPDNEIESYIVPYRNHINKDMDNILAYNPITQDKSIGKWQTNIGNLFATSTLELCNPIFKNRTNQNIDFCLLNHGGIRAIIPKGNVTTRTAYNIMPFENSIMVIALSGNQVYELANYLLADRKPHPLAGIKIYINKNETEVLNIEIENRSIDRKKTYYVATSDYLANGGDNMTFFKDSKIRYDLDYKLRSLLLDYFSKNDTIPNITTQQIIIK